MATRIGQAILWAPGYLLQAGMQGRSVFEPASFAKHCLAAGEFCGRPDWSK